MAEDKLKLNYIAIIAGVLVFVVVSVVGNLIINSLATPLPLAEFKEKTNEIMNKTTIYSSAVLLAAFGASGFVGELIAGGKGLFYGAVVGVTNFVISFLFILALVGLAKFGETLTHMLSFGTIISIGMAILGGVAAEKWLLMKK